MNLRLILALAAAIAVWFLFPQDAVDAQMAKVREAKARKAEENKAPDVSAGS